MLLESNFSFQRWYYPLPDYKFPMAIFSDEYLPEMSDIDAIKFNYPIESELIAEEIKKQEAQQLRDSSAQRLKEKLSLLMLEVLPIIMKNLLKELTKVK